MGKKVLLVVDVQKDFCPGGALAVPKGDEVVPVINGLLTYCYFEEAAATLDWHPENHCSFKENGGLWPKHCVQHTRGSELHNDLTSRKIHVFTTKGKDQDKEAYSGFDGTNLENILKIWKTEKVFVCGLATDYCVKATALDSQKAGFETFVIIDACRGVNVNEGDVEKAVKEMQDAGIKIITSKEV